MKNLSKRLLRSTKKWVIPSIGVLALVIFSGLILFEATKATVDITQNGEKVTVKTHSSTVGDLIDELGLVIGEHDEFSHKMDASVTNGIKIYHKEAKPVFLTIDGEKTEYYTTADNIAEFLDSEEFEFNKHDDLSFDINDDITTGLNMTVKQAFQVTINDGGKETKVWTTGGLVSDILEEQDVTFNKHDKVKPSIDNNLSDKASIQITRVEKKSDKVEETVAFKTEKREDSSLDKGKEKVITDGQEGKIVKTYEITKENGKEVDRKLVDETVKKEKQNKVVAIGTKEAPEQNLVTLSSKTENKPASKTSQKQSTTAKQSSSSEPSGQELYMTASAYSADCKGCSGITATGINLKANRDMKIIAVDPSVIPLGSTVWVEGYGTAIAGDTGGAIKGNRIDVHVPSHEEAMRFGFKKVKVKIIK